MAIDNRKITLGIALTILNTLIGGASETLCNMVLTKILLRQSESWQTNCNLYELI
jgi:hypothetical protein